MTLPRKDPSSLAISKACLNCFLLTKSVNSSTKFGGMDVAIRSSIAKRQTSAISAIEIARIIGPNTQPADLRICIKRLGLPAAGLSPPSSFFSAAGGASPWKANELLVLNKNPTRTSKTSVNLDNVPDMKYPLISVSILSILLKTPKVTL